MLNETLRLKESLKDAHDDVHEKDEPQMTQSKQNKSDDIQIIKETLGQKQKCNECDFVTCVPKYIKGHKVVKHTTGQYQCQRGHGCKAAFKTLKELDSHIKRHTQIQLH